jgi:hypothetical protein
MQRIHLLVLSAVCAVSAAGASFAADLAPIQSRMSPSDFHAAGLDKLSPAELKSLDDWLKGNNTTTTTYVTPTGAPVFYPKSSDREVVESRIDGRFTGWYGNNVFKLENGQEWTQAESGQMTGGKYDHPKVKIKPMLLGSWLMYVEPCGCSVRVNRTK